MMCQLKTCCCRFSLRTGCKISAVYTIIIGLFYIASCSWMLTSLAPSVQLVKVELSKQYPNVPPETIDTLAHNVAQSGVQYVKIIVIISLVLYIIWVLTGISIFAAVNTKRRGFLLPWVIATAVLIGMTILTIVVSMVKIELLIVAILGVSLLCKVWAFLCVISFYRNKCLEADKDAQYKDADRDAGTRLVTPNVEVAYEKLGTDDLA